jgi:hypothetical protein
MSIQAQQSLKKVITLLEDAIERSRERLTKAKEEQDYQAAALEAQYSEQFKKMKQGVERHLALHIAPAEYIGQD